MINVEDYIGRFLLKNKYCPFPGLGTLELHNTPATGSQGKLEAPKYKIKFSPVGIIDDAFPTFIADHENVSIAKASNEIKSFSAEVKENISRTGKYGIEYLGEFYRENGVIQFKQYDDLNLGFTQVHVNEEEAPVVHTSEQKPSSEKFGHIEYTHEESRKVPPRTSSIVKYLLSLILLVGLAYGAYYLYQYYSKNKTNKSETPVNVEEQPIQLDTLPAEMADTLAKNGDSIINNIVADNPVANKPAVAAGEFEIAVKSYPDSVSANGKSNMHNKNGNKTYVKNIGDKYWLVFIASSPTGDTTALKDSMRRFVGSNESAFLVK